MRNWGWEEWLLAFCVGLVGLVLIGCAYGIYSSLTSNDPTVCIDQKDWTCEHSHKVWEGKVAVDVCDVYRMNGY